MCTVRVPRFAESLPAAGADATDDDPEPAAGDVVTGSLHSRFIALPTEQRQGIEGFARLAQMGGVK